MGLVNKIVVVSAEQETQKNRLQMRSKLSAEQVAQRLESQAPISEKVKFADWVISNEGDIRETEVRVRCIWDELTAQCCGN
jgi:dephospho-CoA kinase